MLIFLLSLSLAHAGNEHSRLVPLFQEAIRTWQHPQANKTSLAVRTIHQLLEREQLNPAALAAYLFVPPIKLTPQLSVPRSKTAWPSVALHAVKLDVIRTTDDWFKDDLYCYFFITDGVIPSGKVSQIYSGLSAGESFNFTTADKVLFPVKGHTQVPSGALIIDYGIIESDGDDTQQLHRLSQLVAELTWAVYQVIDPVEAALWGSLRQEMVALAQAVASLNHDDRLATGTIVLTADEAHRLWGEASVATIVRKHQNNHFFDKWRYRLVWRLLKD